MSDVLNNKDATPAEEASELRAAGWKLHSNGYWSDGNGDPLPWTVAIQIVRRARIPSVAEVRPAPPSMAQTVTGTAGIAVVVGAVLASIQQLGLPPQVQAWLVAGAGFVGGGLMIAHVVRSYFGGGR